MLIKAFKHLLRDYPLHVFLLVVLMFLLGVMECFSVAAIAPMIDASGDISTSETKISQLFYRSFGFIGINVSIVNILFLVLIVVILKSLLGVFSSFMTKTIQTSYEIKSKSKLLELLLNADMVFLNKLNFGNILNVVTQETRLMSSIVTYASIYIKSILVIAIYLGLVLLISWKLTLLTFVIGAFVYLILHKFNGIARSLGGDIVDVRSLIQEIVQNAISGYRMIKCYNLESSIQSRFKNYLANLKRNEVVAALLGTVQLSFFEPVMILLSIVAIVFWGVPIASFIVFLGALTRMYTYLRTVQNSHYKISFFMASMDKYEELTKSLQQYQLKKLPYAQEYNLLQKGITAREQVYYYGSSPDDFCLGPLNINIDRGKITGLVGKSGSGKSTFTDLIVGLINPKSGSILIDDIDLATLNINTFRQRIGYVNQEPFLFNDSILNNITLKEDYYTLEDVKLACKLAHIDQFIEGLSDKYETIVGENATSLSGGQRQRIALARAFVRKPEILILDEATSSLDNETENKIQGTLLSLQGSMTIIIIAHRLSTVKNADIVYVFDKGKIVEKGEYEYLANLGGHFANLYSHEQQTDSG